MTVDREVGHGEGVLNGDDVQWPRRISFGASGYLQGEDGHEAGHSHGHGCNGEARSVLI